MAKNSVIFSFVAILVVGGLWHHAIACGGFFEEAPPLLPYYLDRLPAKSFGQIYIETSPSRPKVPAPDEASIRKIGDDIAKEEQATLVLRVDKLLEAARESYENGYWCNLLHDVRDALSSGAKRNDIAEYIRWRLDNADLFKLKVEDENAYPPKPPKKIEGSAGAIDLEKRAEGAPPELKAQWLYLRGAIGFVSGDRKECEKWFERVKTEYPGHPRAEIALFMCARCKFAQSREDSWDGQDAGNLSGEAYQKAMKDGQLQNTERRNKAIALFREYLDTYPSGSFTADVYGWLGALYRENGDEAGALNSFFSIPCPGPICIIRAYESRSSILPRTFS